MRRALGTGLRGLLFVTLFAVLGCGQLTASSLPDAGGFDGSAANEGGASNEEGDVMLPDVADGATTADRVAEAALEDAPGDSPVGTADSGVAPEDAGRATAEATSHDAAPHANDAGLCPAQVPQPTMYPYSPIACPLAASAFPLLVCGYPTAPCPNRFSCVCVSGQGGAPTCSWAPGALTCADAGDAMP